MKARGYRVHITIDSVSVEHRAPFRPRILVLFGIAELCCYLLPELRHVFLDLYRSSYLAGGAFALSLLLLQAIFGISWLLFASGEVMRCDSRELQFAQRRTWGRWHRSRFSISQVRDLKRASRGGSKHRYYIVLTFRADGTQYDMLEDLTTRDSEAILMACKALGYDANIPVNEGAVMLRDIEKRGWFINPLKPD